MISSEKLNKKNEIFQNTTRILQLMREYDCLMLKKTRSLTYDDDKKYFSTNNMINTSQFKWINNPNYLFFRLKKKKLKIFKVYNKCI